MLNDTIRCPPSHSGSLQPKVTHELPTRRMTGRLGVGGKAGVCRGVCVQGCACRGVCAGVCGGVCVEGCVWGGVCGGVCVEGCVCAGVCVQVCVEGCVCRGVCAGVCVKEYTGVVIYKVTDHGYHVLVGT